MAAVRHPIFARFFDRFSQGMEKEVGPYRDEMLAGLSGRVLEVGAGNGMNFARYPATVDEVVALEPEPYLRQKAEAAARSAPVRVTVRDGVAHPLPLEDDSFDAAVASLVLCSVPDPDHAIAELRRVLRPGGELRFLEHVAARSPRLALLQRALDATLWPRMMGGCHTTRYTEAAIRGAGFQMEERERFSFRAHVIGTPVAPRILGRARRPAQALR